MTHEFEVMWITTQMPVSMRMQFPVPIKNILGITLDNQLKFREHIKDYCKKAPDKLHEPRKIRFFTDEKIR